MVITIEITVTVIDFSVLDSTQINMTLRDMNRKIMDLQVTSASAAAGFLFSKDKRTPSGMGFRCLSQKRVDTGRFK